MERVVCGGLAFRKIHFAVLKDSFCRFEKFILPFWTFAVLNFCRFEGIDLSKMDLVCRGCITSP